MKKRVAILGLLLLGVACAQADTVTLNAVADTRLLSFSPNSNDDINFLSVYNQTNNNQHSVLLFDYSSLAGKVVSSATLRLYGKSYFLSTASTSIDFYRVTGDWSESQVTWNSSDSGMPWSNPGGDAVGTSGSQLTDPYTHWTGNGTNVGTWFEFDLTSLVSGAVSGQFDNHGILMAGELGNQLGFVSSEGHAFNGLESANVPELVVEYSAVPEPSTLLALGGLAALTIRRRRRSRR